MKYLKLFETETERDSYLNGEGGLVLPNISVIRSNKAITYRPLPDNNDILEFPLYLISGDNGQVGIDLYNYLLSLNLPIGNEIMFKDYNINNIILIADGVEYLLNKIMCLLIDDGMYRFLIYNEDLRNEGYMPTLQPEGYFG